MSNTIELAREMDRALITRDRDDGKPYTFLRDGSPEWMTEACHAAHGQMFPDDWRYKLIARVVSAIAELDDDANEDDIQERISEIDSDVYTHALIDWLGSHSERQGFTEEAFNESGSRELDLSSALQAGQHAEIDEIAGSLIAFLTERADQTTCASCGGNIDPDTDLCATCDAEEESEAAE